MKTTHKIIATLAGAALLVVLGAAAVFWSFGQIDAAAEARRHTRTLVIGATELLSELKDAETGQRGYVLTGDEAFLQVYLAVRDDLGTHLQELRQTAGIAAAREHLDTLSPLLDAKLAELARVIELRRKNDIAGALSLIRAGKGKHAMDLIRTEIDAFIGLEEDALERHEAEFQTNMRRMFVLIVFASLLMLLFAIAFAYFIYRETQQRLQKLVHLETVHLLESQKSLNSKLQQANDTLQVSEEKLAVTLYSIGDAVMVTDDKGRVTLLNPLAEQLTGWTQAKAVGRAVDEVFHIINQETRLPASIPVMETLAKGTIQGLANHTVLIALDGSESAIADSCAPIRVNGGRVVGAVLVFR
ncbi:MAG: CHASE3 domain-containing protein, partial [Gallionellaceae bacterium]|nr:CHASE3 domain-containing protein [Gallionellaceae bacterium]